MHTSTPFDPNTREPVEAPPSGSWDMQVHVLADEARYPQHPAATYRITSATVTAALAMHATLGIDRGLLVQPTAYRMDHRALVDALETAGTRYRGCALIDESVSDGELDRLHEAGVRAARFHFVDALGMVPTPEAFRRDVERVHARGWFVKVQVTDTPLEQIAAALDGIDVPVLLDHFGPLQFGNPDDPGLLSVQQWLSDERHWLSLSNGDRKSTEGRPWHDAIAVARRLVALAPDRLVWSSDWPHPLHPGRAPNDAELLELLYTYATDPLDRHRILVDNPHRLLDR